jgi:hypothetical protein
MGRPCFVNVWSSMSSFGGRRAHGRARVPVCEARRRRPNRVVHLAATGACRMHGRRRGCVRLRRPPRACQPPDRAVGPDCSGHRPEEPELEAEEEPEPEAEEEEQPEAECTHRSRVPCRGSGRLPRPGRSGPAARDSAQRTTALRATARDVSRIRAGVLRAKARYAGGWAVIARMGGRCRSGPGRRRRAAGRTPCLERGG